MFFGFEDPKIYPFYFVRLNAGLKFREAFFEAEDTEAKVADFLALPAGIRTFNFDCSNLQEGSSMTTSIATS